MTVIAGASWSHAGQTDTAGALVCRQAKATKARQGSPTRAHALVDVDDRFTSAAGEEPSSLWLRRTRALCLPAIEGPAIITMAASGFAGIDVEPPRGADRPSGATQQLLRGGFGELTVEVNGLARMLASAVLAPGQAGTPASAGKLAGDLSCYRVQATSKGGTLGLKTFTTADGRWTLRVQKPRRLCIPADTAAAGAANGLDYLCYRAKAKRGADVPTRGELVSATTAHGEEVLRIGHAAELCFPTERTTVPTDDVRLAVSTTTPTIEWRETADFTVTATFEDGGTEDWTERVAWTSSDDDTAPPDSEPGVSGRFRGLEPGSVTIRATDAATGATASAPLTIGWSLQRIELSPKQVNRGVGQREVYQATGYFPNGVTHNVTSRLVYTSSDPDVAAPANAAPSPSAVEAQGFGTATITACDPRTDICTGVDDDAEMIVLGGLQSIRIEPGTRQAVLPGQGANFTAIGRFADGREKNLTQRVTWASSNPDVIEAPNAAPNRGRVRGHSPGGAFLRATDPQTGVQSFGHQVFVLGDLQSVLVRPRHSKLVRHPGSYRFTAIGSYEGGGSLNLTQQVEWTSETPAIGVAPNQPGDRSRIDAAGAGGIARIGAREPASGIAGSDGYFNSLGTLERVVVSSFIFGRPSAPYNRLFVGETKRIRAFGIFDHGSVNLLGYFRATTTLVSSNPSVAEVVDGRSVRALAPGTFTLRATDTVTGITSDETEFAVQGEIQGLSLRRGESTVLVGGDIHVRVRGHYFPNVVTDFTGVVNLISSDPSIAQVVGPAGSRTLKALAPGWVTISAVDPATGIGTSGEGNVRVLILPDEPPTEITIQPPVSRLPVGGFDDFTATAHYSSGQTVNVTQQATWSSSSTAVAEVVPTDGHGNSHTVGKAAGITFVTAVYGGTSSADSGHDAVVFVDDAVEIDVYPSSATLGVGETRAFQAVAELAGGGAINVTHMVELVSLDPEVADFGDPDQPNLLTAITVGDATLDIGLPDGVRATVSVSVTETTTTTATSTTTSTTLPGGGFGALTIAPSSQTVDFGEDAVFTATLTAADGTTQDVTNRVRWKTADKSIASGSGGVLATHDPGTTTVSAVDPSTGASAAPASLTVAWSLEGITLYPRQVNRGIGDYERFEAIGHFPDGRDLPITTRLLYTSSAPAVAAVQPAGSWPSQVVAKAEGEATISACDPLSGLCSRASGGDAAVLVAGGLQWIELQPGGVANQFPGGAQQYTAIGHYDDGSSADITASVEWISTAPGVALASNLAGSHGRVFALTPGLSFILARDPDTGIHSTSAPFYTLGAIQQLWVHVPDVMQAGASAFAGAFAEHVGGGQSNVTQQVTWGSRDSAVAVTPNAAGAKNRIDAVDQGVARIFATDPGTGVTSGDGHVFVYGALERVDASWTGGGWPSDRVGIGGTRTYRAVGVFGGGYSENFTRSGRPYTLVSSDPAVAKVIDRTTVEGVAAGTVTITAVDDATGLTGSGASLTVQGHVTRIVLEPATKLRGISEYQTFTATGYFPPDDSTATITQNLVYASSNPAVAVVFNDPNINKSTIFTVGPGTTVISATDPVTGVSSSDSGDDAIVEVIDGVPDQIVVSPPYAFRMLDGSEEFTAVAHYPDGTTINVTQQVTWSSSDASVAGAFLPNRRSLMRGNAPGVVSISATHPSGVSSTASGHDAVMEVDAVQSLAISPTSRTLRVGESEEFTVLATFARGGERNVTQSVFYWASPLLPQRLVATNPDRASRFTAVAPGVANVTAWHGGRQVVAQITVLPAGSPSGAFLMD